MVREILLLGDPRLYQVSSPVEREEIGILKAVVQDLHDTLIDFRKKYGLGRAIAAPQIGVFKRLIYMQINEPVVFVNPVLHFPDDELMEVLDDCMSFPGLLVRVKRYKRCIIQFKDLDFRDHELKLEGDLSELLQHEYDHLDGILATMRAVDDKALYFKSPKMLLNDE